MKTTFLLILSLLIYSISFSQRYYSNNDTFKFKANGIIYMYHFDPNDKKLSKTEFYTEYGHFIKIGEFKDISGNKITTNYFLMRLANVQDIPDNTGEKEMKRSDFGKIYAIEIQKFDELFKKDFILKRYDLWKDKEVGLRYGMDFTYGAQISVPFKLRPPVNSQPLRLTPELNLGGFIGARLRIKRYHDAYLYPFVLSAGVGTVGINENNTINENSIKGDSQILAANASTGFVFRWKDFQLGFLTGWDWATGDLGKEWVYQGRPWYSIAIGFRFLEFEGKASKKN